jgi:aryl-alcohol dehydrogenase-like predicted oxidoreductase
MHYRNIEKLGIELSVIGLGGHEYLDDGSSRGFNEDRQDAVKPGYIGQGYGGVKRRELLKVAYENGINFFDVTIDPENRKMANYDLLKAEVQRILTLIQRDHIDFLNFPFLQPALDADPEYLDKMRHNVAELKREGLIRFATADNFSGERTYTSQILAGCFNTLAMNFSFADSAACQTVLPAAQSKGMGIITREVFQKGRLFKMGQEAGIADRGLLARISLRWNLSIPQVTTALIGADHTAHLQNSLSILDHLEIAPEENEILQKLLTSPTYQSYSTERQRRFLGE